MGSFCTASQQETCYNLFGWETLLERYFSITSRILYLGDKVPLDEDLIKETRLYFIRQNFLPRSQAGHLFSGSESLLSLWLHTSI